MADAKNDPAKNDLAKSAFTENEPLILADNLVKIYKTPELEVMALQGLDLEVKKGELLAIIGNSGSGKSTFLNMLGGLDTPSAGRLYVDGKNLFTMTPRELVIYKRDTVGFVWQNNARNLLPYLSAIENIMTPMHFASEHKKKEKATQLLELVGLSHKKNSRLSQLSGGEQQRIAIAIALANSPKVLLADEPTGSVDRKTADYILDIFKSMNRDMGQTILIVTHDVELSKMVPRVVAIRDGKISSERIADPSYWKKAASPSHGVTAENIYGKENASESVNSADTDKNRATAKNVSETGSGTGAAADNTEINSVHEFSHEKFDMEEFAVLDRANRVQIPAKLLEEAGITSKHLRIEVEGNTIVLRE